jgi:hypothetical protein
MQFALVGGQTGAASTGGAASDASVALASIPPESTFDAPFVASIDASAPPESFEVELPHAARVKASERRERQKSGSRREERKRIGTNTSTRARESPCRRSPRPGGARD